MSEERKPVICPWCGGNMGISFSEDPFGKIYSRYECEACGTASPFGKPADGEVAAKHNAYLAATATPTNRPLTREELYYTLDSDPVWRVDKYGNRKVLDGFSAWSGHNDKLFLYFATKPTLDDIEAARKERT